MNRFTLFYTNSICIKIVPSILLQKAKKNLTWFKVGVQPTMAQRCQISRPMLVDGNIWYILHKAGRYQWMMYNTDLDVHSFVAVIPNQLSFEDMVNSIAYPCVADGVYIYIVSNDKNVIVFDTVNKTYCIKITAKWFKNGKFRRQVNKPYFISNGQIFAFSEIYDIKSQNLNLSDAVITA